MASNGQRPARTALDVAQLEADNEYLHNENERINRELAIVSADRSRLQIENALLEGKARENLLKATRMETIVRVHSSGLVQALTEITQERTTERAVRRQVQEQQLEEETGAAPSFLTRGTDRTRPRDHDAGFQTDGHATLNRDDEGERGDERPALPAPVRDEVQPEARRESDQDREDRLRGAAERLAGNRMPPRTPRIDTTLADRDSRMPGGPFVRDQGTLEELAGVIKSAK